MKRVRVLHLILQLGAGGMEAMVAFLAAAADRTRYDVDVWSLDLGGEVERVLRRQGISVRVLNKGTGFRIGFLRRFRRELAAGRFDIIHAHNPPAARWALAGTLGGAARPRLIRTEHTFTSHRMTSFSHALTGGFYDRIIGVSKVTTEAHRRLDPFWANRYLSIPNGIPMSLPLPEPKTARRILGQLGVSPDAPLIMNIGNLREPKGHDALLEAARLVFNVHREARLVVFGDGPLRHTLEDRARNLGIADQVHFVGYRSDAPVLLTGADVYAQSSRREGMPVSLLEASRASCPIVATAVGGTPEVLNDGETGILVPVGDVKGLADAIVRLLTNRAEARALGERARAFVLREFDAAVVVRRTEAVYEEVLSAKGKPVTAPTAR